MSDVVSLHLDQYPDQVRVRLLELRDLIIRTASKLEVGEVEQTLKWGEPSFHVKSGSPVRMDWKEKAPDQYYLFFNCKTRLIETFKELYRDSLVFEGNRAIVLPLSEPLPETAVKHCLQLALRYHSVKHLPLLGA
ncbi:DUF1801 domain-containing protein [Oceanospirillum linum]|uniref:YdhG-like domain-containing protein n=1 Tax=Oceanospirillum linum TaxID=966 RepID=A0A1T1HEY4_OCELI|nr:DUF1801 domain-containing protein [Oceanospirillum linum]OOV88365.1 hypothetical protein BTA35_0202285 [Oceanospirillum linum]SEF53555.1 protein of unknown function (DU1801) [Oleiphilus messinensis]SMP04709.1 protein of unknown function (DU1801) [Oceanospirillum linum]